MSKLILEFDKELSSLSIIYILLYVDMKLDMLPYLLLYNKYSNMKIIIDIFYTIELCFRLPFVVYKFMLYLIKYRDITGRVIKFELDYLNDFISIWFTAEDIDIALSWLADKLEEKFKCKVTLEMS